MKILIDMSTEHYDGLLNKCIDTWPAEYVTLKNGVVIHKPLDNLATRARKAERLWLQQNRMNTIYDRPPKKGRKKQKRPSKTVYRPAPFEDVVMDVLNRKGRS